MKYLYKKITALLLLTIIIFHTASGCGKNIEPLSETGFYFDTVITITLYDSEDSSVLKQCFDLAGYYEKLFSKTMKGSDIWNINHAGGEAVTVSEDTSFLINKALYYAGLTGGKLDPSIGAVSNLWNFSDNPSKILPSDNQLKQALSHVDYQNIIVSGNEVTLTDASSEIDLGFIAKGYIADKMKEFLISEHIKSALINLGGNIIAIGSKPDHTPFRVGIQQPFSTEGTSAAILSVTGLSVVSSGNYERYFEKDGKIYHHILDSKTGYPIWNNLSEVTILSGSSTEGDVLSTTCFILGLTDGMKLIESLDGIEALFITNDGMLHPSSGFPLS